MREKLEVLTITWSQVTRMYLPELFCLKSFFKQIFKTCFKHQIKLNMFFLNNLKQMFKTLFKKNVFLIPFSRGEDNIQLHFTR